jgi:hypothetical protein
MKIEEALDVLKDFCKPWDKCSEDGCSTLTAAVRSALALIDKFPKTADGVPVLPGMVLWYRSPAGIIPSEPVRNWADLVGYLDDQGCVFYSTREAAEAAGGE